MKALLIGWSLEAEARYWIRMAARDRRYLQGRGYECLMEAAAERIRRRVVLPEAIPGQESAPKHPL